MFKSISKIYTKVDATWCAYVWLRPPERLSDEGRTPNILASMCRSGGHRCTVMPARVCLRCCQDSSMDMAQRKAASPFSGHGLGAQQRRAQDPHPQQRGPAGAGAPSQAAPCGTNRSESSVLSPCDGPHDSFVLQLCIFSMLQNCASSRRFRFAMHETPRTIDIDSIGQSCVESCVWETESCNSLMRRNEPAHEEHS